MRGPPVLQLSGDTTGKKDGISGDTTGKKDGSADCLSPLLCHSPGSSTAMGSGHADRREQQGPIVTDKDALATSSSLRRSNSGPQLANASASSTAPSLGLRRIKSDSDLLQHQHFDASTGTWAKGIPRAGSTSPRVQQIHREMLDVFEEAVEDELVVQVAAVSPGRRRYRVSPEPRPNQAQKRLRLVNNRGNQKTLPSRRASQDGSPVAAAEKASAASGRNSSGAAGGIGQPAASGIRGMLWWTERFNFERPGETNDAFWDFMLIGSFLVINGLFGVLLIWVWCHDIHVTGR